MRYRRKLFSWKKLYDTAGTDSLFVRAMRENLEHHARLCPPYAELLERQGFSPEMLQDPGDLRLIPALPTLFLKEREMFTIPYDRLLIKASSSGTSGAPALMGLDTATAWQALRMVWHTFRHYRLLTPRPANYIVLGYEPSDHNKAGAAQTAYAATLAAPALHREYALKSTGNGYRLNLEGIREALLRYEKQGQPVRFMGFPSYFYFLLEMLRDEGVNLKLHPKSKVLLAGGWKQFFFQETGKQELYDLAKSILDISGDNCKDFYGAVEHPVVYCDCPRHHFHVPVYSRVLIRDPVTLEPVPYGVPGIINLMTPLMGSMPFASVLTDDLAVLRPAEECGCGIESPWFELLGRAGLDIKTCAAGASELLKEVGL